MNQILEKISGKVKKILIFDSISCINERSAEIAQLVEQRIRNAWVVCSSHILGTIFIPYFKSPLILCRILS